MRLKRRRAGSTHGEPRTEPPSDEVPRSSGIPLRMGEAAKPVPGPLYTEIRERSVPANAPRNPSLRPLAPGGTHGYVALFVK